MHSAFAQPSRDVEPPVPAGFSLYVIDGTRSDVRWRVYRDGALAPFGHDHLIVVAGMSGRVLVHPRFDESRFELEIPVDRLVVDTPTDEGADAGRRPPSTSDIARTRERMLGDEVLDAERFAQIRVAGIGPTVQAGDQFIEITIEIRGGLVPLTVPTRIEVSERELEATGAFRVTHEELGMEPFSAMMGALRVRQPLDVTYRIVARRTE